MNNIIDLEYYDAAIVAYYLDGTFKIYPYDKKEELLRNIYIPNNLTVVNKIRSKEIRKEINNMIDFYFNHDTLDINYRVKKYSK